MQKLHSTSPTSIRVLVFLMLSIYGAVLFADSVHQYVAHQKVVNKICSLESETNSCHRAIYHHDTEKGCDHEAHFIVPVVECDHCVLAITNHIGTAGTLLYNHTDKHIPDEESLTTQEFANSYSPSTYHRGPPA